MLGIRTSTYKFGRGAILFITTSLIKIKIRQYKAIKWYRSGQLGEICLLDNKKKLQMADNIRIILCYNFKRKHTFMWLYYYSLFGCILSTLTIYNLTFEDHLMPRSHGPTWRASELIWANLEVTKIFVSLQELRSASYVVDILSIELNWCLNIELNWWGRERKGEASTWKNFNSCWM